MTYKSPRHDPDCRWERAECEYKATHYFCPHPEHACNCSAPVRAQTSDLVERMRKLVAARIVAPDLQRLLEGQLTELEAWERSSDQRH